MATTCLANTEGRLCLVEPKVVALLPDEVLTKARSIVLGAKLPYSKREISLEAGYRGVCVGVTQNRSQSYVMRRPPFAEMAIQLNALFRPYFPEASRIPPSRRTRAC